MPPRPARWSVLLPVGLALYVANHAIVVAIRRVAYDLDALLPEYGAVSLALTVWYAWLLCALGGWRAGDLEGSPGRPGRGVQLGLSLTVAALVVLHVGSLPQGSIDAVTYVLHGYFQVEHGIDPYSAVPATALEGELGPALASIGYNASHVAASPYGPLWSHIEVAVWWCTRDLHRALHAFQALAVVALGACAWLMVRLGRAQRTGLAPGAIALAFVLNPVVLVESAWDAHLDVTAYALALAALASVDRAPRRWWWALCAALAINVKLPFVLFLPALVVRAAAGGDWRALGRAALGAVLVLLATSAVLYAPYWHGLSTLASLSEHTQRDGALRFIALAVAALAVALALRERQLGTAETLALRERQLGTAETLALRERQLGTAETLALRERQLGTAETLALRERQLGTAETLALRERQLGTAGTLALHERRHGSAAGSPATALPMTLIGGAYWLPWHSVASVGELLRLGARGFVYVAVLTLVGRLGTGVYFTASQHYGQRFEWPSALLLPGGLYRIALGVLLLVWVARLVRRARVPRPAPRSSA